MAVTVIWELLTEQQKEGLNFVAKRLENSEGKPYEDGKEYAVAILATFGDNGFKEKQEHIVKTRGTKLEKNKTLAAQVDALPE